VIVLLGGSGYVGSAFRSLFERRGVEFISLKREELDYYQREKLISFLRDAKASFLVNAAGYTGKPNVDACELFKADSLLGNAVLPGMIRESCEQVGIPWGHVSSGCIYTGHRADGSGFTETDPPNFCFRTNNCSFYSGTKALGEECLQGAEQVYVWRLRIPFNEIDSPRNYLSKLINYSRLLEAANSISQLDEFVSACWETWKRRVPFGTYNITNPGVVTTREVAALIEQELLPGRQFDFFADEHQFMQQAAKTPRSNCILDCSKLFATGIELTPVHDAIRNALRTWQTHQ
jgi:dTDP-4-dehydrorhamnose reductase